MLYPSSPDKDYNRACWATLIGVILETAGPQTGPPPSLSLRADSGPAGSEHAPHARTPAILRSSSPRAGFLLSDYPSSLRPMLTADVADMMSGDVS